MLACDGIHHNSPVFMKNRVRNGRRKIWKPALLFCKLGNPEQMGKTKNDIYFEFQKKKNPVMHYPIFIHILKSTYTAPSSFSITTST